MKRLFDFGKSLWKVASSPEFVVSYLAILTFVFGAVVGLLTAHGIY